jgi:hypothetical protein
MLKSYVIVSKFLKQERRCANVHFIAEDNEEISIKFSIVGLQQLLLGEFNFI